MKTNQLVVKSHTQRTSLSSFLVAPASVAVKQLSDQLVRKILFVQKYFRSPDRVGGCVSRQKVDRPAVLEIHRVIRSTCWSTSLHA